MNLFKKKYILILEELKSIVCTMNTVCNIFVISFVTDHRLLLLRLQLLMVVL